MKYEKKYEIDILDPKSLKGLENTFDDLLKIFKTEEFMQYFAGKCLEELDKIMAEKLRTEDFETEYRSSNKYKIETDKLEIYNDSTIDLSELSEETRLNYPNGLSLAKLIEFGTGIPRNT